MSITWLGSPNYTKGRDGQRITRIVIHWMAGTLAATDAVFQDRNRQTSAHYGIEDNTIHQYVSEADTAYHAGQWAVNLSSIGIEHSAQPGRDASEATYQSSARLIAEICSRYGLPINANTIIPHRSIVATQCPGTIDLSKLISMAQAIAQGGDVYNGKTAEQWAKECAILTAIATAREDYLNKIAFAEGSGVGAIEEDDVNRIIAGIDRRNKRIEALEAQLGTVATDLKPGIYRVV